MSRTTPSCNLDSLKGLCEELKKGTLKINLYDVPNLIRNKWDILLVNINLYKNI